MSNIKSPIKLLIVLLGIALFSLIPLSKVLAVSILSQSCNASDTTASVCQDGNTNPNAPNPIFGSNGVLTEAIEIVAFIVGVASIIMIIISALRMVLSGGDSNTVNSARSAILYSLIGVVIALSAQGIVVFILKKV